MTREQAEAEALALTKRAEIRALDVVKKGTPRETFAAWSERWTAEREARGLATVDDDRGRLRKWILPDLGERLVATMTRADVEGLVEQLDRKVRAGALSWRTARNVWALVTKACSDACASKVRALRVREDNPAVNVRGPDRGVTKAKSYLYPAELLALATCPAVPAPWRCLYLVTAYLYIRAAEARALGWEDIDTEHGIVLVHRSAEGKRAKKHDAEDTKVTKGTKGKRSRRVPIEPTLRPLLVAMRDTSGGKGPVFPRVPVEKALAPLLRRHLELAGVRRAELHANDATRKRLGFHDLRATGITWLAVRGDDPLKIQARAGHENFATTSGYIRAAEAAREGFGEVFPALSPTLVSSLVSAYRFGANGHPYEIKGESGVGEAGFEPATTSTQSSCTTGLCDSPWRRCSADRRGG